MALFPNPPRKDIDYGMTGFPSFEVGNLSTQRWPCRGQILLYEPGLILYYIEWLVYKVSSCPIYHLKVGEIDYSMLPVTMLQWKIKCKMNWHHMLSLALNCLASLALYCLLSVPSLIALDIVDALRKDSQRDICLTLVSMLKALWSPCSFYPCLTLHTPWLLFHYYYVSKGANWSIISIE